MTGSFILVAFFDKTDPGVAGWLVLAVWFVLFVLVLNTIIFFLRRLFRRWRARKRADGKVRHGEKQA
jgi:threonine/homoserine/homoserine lactone efflux protein